MRLEWKRKESQKPLSERTSKAGELDPHVKELYSTMKLWKAIARIKQKGNDQIYFQKLTPVLTQGLL